MKYSFNGVFVVAEAENQQDNETLMSGLTPPKDKRTTKRHKKHNFPKTCHCGKVCKGLQGLGIHKANCKVPNPDDLPF